MESKQHNPKGTTILTDTEPNELDRKREESHY